MLVKGLIVLGVFLSIMCFVWFFVSEKYFSHMKVLFFDAILIVLSIGMFTTGFLTRNLYINEEDDREWKMEQLRPMVDEIELRKNREDISPQNERENEEMNDMMEKNSPIIREEKQSENKNISEQIGQTTETIEGSSQMKEENDTETVPPEEAEKTPETVFPAETESFAERESVADTENSTAAGSAEVSSEAGAGAPPAGTEIPESEPSQEVQSNLGEGTDEVSQTEPGAAESPDLEITGQ